MGRGGKRREDVLWSAELGGVEDRWVAQERGFMNLWGGEWEERRRGGKTWKEVLWSECGVGRVGQEKSW